ncbi:MAG: DNA-binding protein [Acidobacteria bacterium]|nr:DNA-binding protein [Acidobacteriota bacterium]
MPLLLFLDANVLFTAAHNPSGKAALLVELGVRGHWKVMTSALAVHEARRNLGIKYTGSLPRLDALLPALRIVASDSGSACPLDLPEKDRSIFLSALRFKATHLLTGDLRHFGPLINDPAKTCGVTVMTVAEFLKA